jgi:hypothetical protein
VSKAHVVILILGLAATGLLSHLLQQAVALRGNRTAVVHREIQQDFGSRMTLVGLKLTPLDAGLDVELSIRMVRPDERLVRDLGHWLWRRLAPTDAVVRVCVRATDDSGRERVTEVARPAMLR